ncbi:MAG TPA: energy transducer TonB [Candidatus Polarisedimenticolia bacterium]|nr:energy transducer TonB [Candidatus Polarisedimenticolia bacterium]
MFEQLLTGRVRAWEPREAMVALVSILFHAAGIVALLAASYLWLTPIPLPQLRPVLIGTVLFPRAGAPAPKLGGSPSAAIPKETVTKRSQSHEEVSQPSTREETAESSAAGIASSRNAQAGDLSAGDGTPDGDLHGSLDGGKGGKCVGEHCDPEGPSGAGPGFEGGTGETCPGIDRVTDPVIIESSKALPRYPDFARRSGVEGQAILQAVIGIDGGVGSIVVLREIPAHVGFGEAAVEAASHWRYLPGSLGGKPVPVQITITVMFTLSR